VPTERDVDAVFNYLDPEIERPAYYLYRPKDGPKPKRPKTSAHTMRVADARRVRDQLSIDREGVELIEQESAVPDFYNRDCVVEQYYPEVEKLVKDHTGATRVLVFDHNVRCAPRCDANEPGISAPVTFVHNDYTLSSGPQRVRDLVGGEEAERLLEHPFAVVNVWRPIAHPVRDTPLAVCDAGSIEQSDFISTDLVYPDRTGEIYSVKHQDRHRWFYVSDMEPRDVMLLKCYDSETDRARFTAHSAFSDPSAPADAPARESIEARTLVFFAPEA
jgi:hypothetical protein